MSNQISDLKHAVRGLKNRPGLAVTVALTFGLGLGLNATVFGLLDALLLRPVLFLVLACSLSHSLQAPSS